MPENNTSVPRVWQRGGPSPNPGGVPRGTAGRIERCRRLALKYAPRAIKALAALLDHPDGHVRRAAAEGLLDRAGLKPFALEPERHEIVAAVDVDNLRELLAARVAALAGAAGESAGPPLLAAPPSDSPPDSQQSPAPSVPSGNATGTAISAEAGTASDMRSGAEDGAAGGTP